jgi:hypothetical protein
MVSSLPSLIQLTVEVSKRKMVDIQLTLQLKGRLSVICKKKIIIISYTGRKCNALIKLASFSTTKTKKIVYMHTSLYQLVIDFSKTKNELLHITINICVYDVHTNSKLMHRECLIISHLIQWCELLIQWWKPNCAYFTYAP